MKTSLVLIIMSLHLNAADLIKAPSSDQHGTIRHLAYDEIDTEEAMEKMYGLCKNGLTVFSRVKKEFQGETIPPEKVKGPIKIYDDVVGGLCKEVSATDETYREGFQSWVLDFVFVIETYYYISFKCNQGE